MVIVYRNPDYAGREILNLPRRGESMGDKAIIYIHQLTITKKEREHARI